MMPWEILCNGVFLLLFYALMTLIRPSAIAIQVFLKFFLDDIIVGHGVFLRVMIDFLGLLFLMGIVGEEAVGLVGTGTRTLAVAEGGGIGGDGGFGTAEDLFEVLETLRYVGGQVTGLLGDVVGMEVGIAVVVEKVELLEVQRTGEELFVGQTFEGMGDDVVLYSDIVEECVGYGSGVFDLEDGEVAFGVFAHDVGEDKDAVVEEAGFEEFDGTFLLEEAVGEGRVAAGAHAKTLADVDGVGKGVFEGTFEGAALVEALERFGCVSGEVGAVDVEVHGTFALEGADVFGFCEDIAFLGHRRVAMSGCG